MFEEVRIITIQMVYKFLSFVVFGLIGGYF